MKAITIFESQVQGILQTFKAADLYAIHLTSYHRGEECCNKQLISDIIEKDAVSGLTILSMFYTAAEKKAFQEKGHLVNIGNLIVLATYTALEIYLINKFKEYFSFRVAGASKINVSAVLDNLPHRSMDNIVELYKDILDIHLPEFEMDRIPVDPHSSFKPKSTWLGIKTIEKARHEIAHNGKSKNYKICLLPDVWDPFNFVRRWVMLFDANFDTLIYESRTSPMV